MKHFYNKILPKLKPFNFDKHFKSYLKDIKWVLINGIANKKVVYIFKNDTLLEIIENTKTIKTSWQHIAANFISIKTEDGEQIVSLHYKDDDLLVINKKGTEDYAFFVDESSYENDLNTEEDLKNFLLNKYINKAKNLIKEHEFYYIKNFKEYGPYSVTELLERVKNNLADERCFVRDINEHDYNNRIRISDLLREL
ncbi:hypothetical protein [Mangrovimonas spongiae]|uniref:Uncharacterized protein n=1 Tax=Mangrovimonas spongiae TaxID=2494697 RepID=A0A428K1B7_9FLAO|nr:hypothetical protein [Mangrovimonas spongiae]RSK40240.1 hypothetical protein EJA19_04475 [Mangrovimonas spongiae]